MKNNKKAFFVLLISCFVLLACIPFIVNLLFYLKAPFTAFAANWTAGEALTYIAGVLTFIGTTFLGWITWKQNQQLLFREEDSFIANNTCTIIVATANIIMDSPVVTGKFEDTFTYLGDTNNNYSASTWRLKLDFSYSGGCPVQYRVSYVEIFINNNYEEKILRKKAINKEYCKTGIDIGKVSTNTYILFDFLEKREIDRLLQKNNTNNRVIINIEMGMEFLTDRYLNTSIIVMAEFRSKDDFSLSIDEWESRIQTLWYGVTILDKAKIQQCLPN